MIVVDLRTLRCLVRLPPAPGDVYWADGETGTPSRVQVLAEASGKLFYAYADLPMAWLLWTHNRAFTGYRWFPNRNRFVLWEGEEAARAGAQAENIAMAREIAARRR